MVILTDWQVTWHRQESLLVWTVTLIKMCLGVILSLNFKVMCLNKLIALTPTLTRILVKITCCWQGRLFIPLSAPRFLDYEKLHNQGYDIYVVLYKLILSCLWDGCDIGKTRSNEKQGLNARSITRTSITFIT